MVETQWVSLDGALERALRSTRDRGAERVVLFSGGVDSGLLAWELRREARTSLFTVGVAGSADLAAAARTAPSIGLPGSGHVLGRDELEGLARRLGPELDGVPGPRRGIFVALAAAVGYAPPGVLVCGQGADELFLGYAHFRGLSAEEAERRAVSDLERLLSEDWPATCRIAGHLGRELVAPYLDPEFVDAAQGVPVRERLPGELPKAWFRRWAAHRGLPEEIAFRPKRAIQYGSGVDRLLRRHEGPPPTAGLPSG